MSDTSEKFHAIDDDMAEEVTVLTRLHDLASSLSGALDLEASLREILKVLGELHRAEFGLVSLYDPVDKCLRPQGSIGISEVHRKSLRDLTPGPKAGACGSCFSRRERAVVTDTETDPRFENWRDFVREMGIRSVHSTPILNRDGGILGVLTVMFKNTTVPTRRQEQLADMCARHAADVIEAARAQRALREREQQLQIAVQTARLGFWDWNVQRGTVYVSEVLRSDWQFPEGTSIVTLEEMMDKVHPEDRIMFSAMLEDALANRRPYNVQYRLRRSSGDVTWIHATANVHHNEGGVPVRMTGTSLDITKDKENENELKRAKSAAEEANVAKSTFLANMSHEIRTPLGAILGFIDLMKNPNVPRTDLDQYIAVIDRNSRQLLRIVDDILDLSKVEAGKMLIEQTEFSLIELLWDFSSLMQFRATEHGIDFELKIETRLPDPVISDPIRIRQILTNIVGNAIKFTERGRVELRITERDSVIEFQVTDTGRGIAPQQRAKLFRPFQQADASTTRRYGGTGLGLVLTKRLCEALGGRFELRSTEIGRGSVFAAEISLQRASSFRWVEPEEALLFSPRRLGVSSESPCLAGLDVLVVEDSTDNQILIRVLLEKLGARIEVAEDGLQGVRQAIGGQHHVVLMDIQMPRMDGHEATQALRAKGYSGPIIALTAHAMKEERQRCRVSGFTDFLSKPIQRDALIETLLRYKKMCH